MGKNKYVVFEEDDQMEMMDDFFKKYGEDVLLTGNIKEADDEDDEEEGVINIGSMISDEDASSISNNLGGNYKKSKKEKKQKPVNVETISVEELLKGKKKTQKTVEKKVNPSVNTAPELPASPNANEAPELPASLNVFKWKVFPDISRMVFDDGIAPTSFNFATADLDIMKHKWTDSDEAMDEITFFENYIIASSHPAAIFTVDEFNQLFRRVKTFDQNKFRFGGYNNYMFCYIVDGIDYVRKVLLESLNYDWTVVIAVYINIAMANCRLDNCCFIEDENYCQILYNSNQVNRRKEFADIFFNNANTKLASEDFDDKTMVMDFDDILTRGREEISIVTVGFGDSGMFFDDDDDDDEDYDNEEEIDLDAMLDHENLQKSVEIEPVPNQINIPVTEEPVKIVETITKEVTEEIQVKTEKTAETESQTVDMNAEDIDVDVDDNEGNVDKITPDDDDDDMTLAVVRKH